MSASPLMGLGMAAGSVESGMTSCSLQRPLEQEFRAAHFTSVCAGPDDTALLCKLGAATRKTRRMLERMAELTTHPANNH